LTAAIINLTGLPNSHLALKVGTALFGLVAIPFTFLLGSLLYGRLVGLAAAFLLAISHWHVAITRVGLRFPFTAAFATPVLYFFLRALAHNRRNDWLLAGLFLGIGLHTYTAMRVLPLISAVLLALTLIHDGMRRLRKAQLRVGDSWTRGFWLNSLLFLVFVLLLLTPLLRYMTDDPASVWIRSTSRAIPETPQTTAVIAEQFLRNVYNAALMFNVRGDVVAMNTIPYEPVLGLVTGALFILGLAYLLWRLLVNRDPRSLLLLIILFFLLLPSILSLAYPGENPSVVRTGGAPPAVMIIAAVPFVAIPTRMSASGSSAAKAAARLMVIALSLIAIVYNANWYFHDYDENILYSIGNATELGAVLADFEAQGATVANAYHIPYPHWIDTRAIGINAGHVRWDNAVEVEDLPAHVYGARPRLYLVNKDDAEALAALQQMFPDGSIERYDSSRFGRDFFIFRVPEKSV
ncbi:MAG: glycosyltransferase family 39 protein, partial [Candidatus Promineifilaceae bacterium]